MKICAISDLHGHLPTLPPCDLLIVAGDVCPDRFGNGWPDPAGQRKWLDREFSDWLARQSFAEAVLTFGNHDFQENSADTRFAVDRSCGTAAGSVWLSPWSNRFGGWAFMKEPHDLAPVYALIPGCTNILVSHGPAYGYGDTVDPKYVIGDADPHVGSHELLATIDRVKPQIVICGHIHGGYGKYQHGDSTIYNVSVVNEQYQLVNAPTLIEVADREPEAVGAVAGTSE